jgi:fumarate hydratase subunit beta
MTDAIHLQTPLKEEELEQLTIGDPVLLSGVVYTARDAAHKRMIEALERGEELPFELKGQVIYYVAPSPASPGRVIGSAGPTTSSRMDPFTPVLLELGVKGLVGKGQRSREVVKLLMEHKAVYFTAVGGAAALLSQTITESRIIAYPDLGPEAVRQLVLKEFPVVVANDIHGNDLFLAGWKRYRRRTRRKD